MLTSSAVVAEDSLQLVGALLRTDRGAERLPATGPERPIDGYVSVKFSTKRRQEARCGRYQQRAP
jgi:hypothetical protein